MCKHEEKSCPRCKIIFECKVGDIPHCQCYAVKLLDDERDFINKRFNDCLCAGCMKAMQSEYNILQRELQLKVFFTGR
jgi:Cysteine-rich CWC